MIPYDVSAQNMVNIGSGNVGMKQLPEPMLTNRKSGPVWHIHTRAILREMLKMYILDMSLKFTCWSLQLQLPWDNKLTESETYFS